MPRKNSAPPETSPEAIQAEPAKVEPAKVEPAKKERKKRQPSKYALFIKDNYSKANELPVKERFKKLAQMWKSN